ncbi:MAG: hypothetical protein K6A80_10665 [Saccharofermentans sp.]|nr:hypothetical protein [Saccharofermentans sp.]
MSSGLYRRIPRDLKKTWGRYLALMILIIASMYIVVSVVGMTEVTIQGTAKKTEENRIQDGQFTTFEELTDEQEKDITDTGVELEKLFYVDVPYGDKTVRIGNVREKIDLIDLDEGCLPQNDDEIVLMNLFCLRNDIKTGGSIELDGKRYTVCGIGSVPDYNLPLKNMSDMTSDPNRFGVAFVSDSAYNNMINSENTGSEIYVYAFRLNGTDASDLKDKLKSYKYDYENSANEYLTEMIDDKLSDRYEFEDGLDELGDGIDMVAEFGFDELKDGFKTFRDETEDFLDEAFEVDISLLEEFTENKDNPRIASDAASDVMIKKSMGLFAGAVILALIAYVISVFTGNQIREESSVIGTLFALGIRKGEIILHYIFMPAFLTLIAGIAGMILGFSKYGVEFQMQDIYEYYSVPQFENIRPLYLILYCVVVPPVISLIVNLIVINGKLSSTALALMRNEDSSRASDAVKARREKKNFISDFSSCQIRREKRSLAAVITGMVISLLLLLLGVSCYVLCNNVKEHNIRDASCEYTYMLKYPPLEIPEDAEECYAKNLKYTDLGYTLDVNVYGIRNDSKYFEARPSEGTNKVVIGTGISTKYGFKEGDIIVLTDSSEDRSYAFEIEGVTEYSIGLTAFMDIGSARELFGAEDDEYNVLFSDRKIDIDDGRVMSVTTKDEIVDTAGIFVDQMMSLVVIMIAISFLIFVTVMYLMENVMIQRASTSISLIKIFGYRPGELKKIFMDGNLKVVALCTLVGIPLCKFLVDKIYPLFIANTAMESDITYPWWLWVMLYIIVMAVYLLINTILTGKINRIDPCEILKNRE